MQFDNTYKYSTMSRFFHGARLILLILIFLTVYGLIPFKYHFSLGFITFFVIIANIIWRLFNQYPESSATSSFEKNVQYIIFFLIYLLLFLGPITGYLCINHNINVLGITISPIYNSTFFADFIQNSVKTDVLSFTKVMKFLHKILLFFILQALIVIHFLAVLFNIIIRKDYEELYKMFLK